jgi:hypothetical protein
LIPKVHPDSNVVQAVSVIADAVLSVQVKALHTGVAPVVSQAHLDPSVRIVSLHHNSSVVISLHTVNLLTHPLLSLLTVQLLKYVLHNE